MIREESVVYLLDEAFLDIEAYFGDLLTSKWQSGSQAIETIVYTLKDYFEDYQFLKVKNFELVITEAQDRVARKYITSMLQNNVLRRKISFTNDAERTAAAAKIKKGRRQFKKVPFLVYEDFRMEGGRGGGVNSTFRSSLLNRLKTIPYYR